MQGQSGPVATSVVLSGGYEDDLDDVDTVIYTGQGRLLSDIAMETQIAL